MIQLFPDQINVVYLTLSEKTTIDNPVYLFSFKGGFSQSFTNFIAQDVSDNTRANKFLIEVSADEDLLNGKVNLESGFYEYTIYQQTSTTNLDPELAEGIVEVGKVNVIADTIPVNTEFERTSNTNTVYQNQ